MIRELRKEDIKAITDICVKGMEYDYLNEDLVREKTIEASDYEPELGIVYEKEGKVVGFAQCAYGPRRGDIWGYIRLLVVHPTYRQQGIGSALLKECEERLAKKDVALISIMDAIPNYLTPGLDYRYTEAFCFLSKHGYEKVGENINLICDVSPDKFDVTEDLRRLEKEGFTIRRAEPDDKEEVLRFIRSEFALWEGEVKEFFRNDPISLHICLRGEEVVGFSGYDGNNKNTGWFGPMGVLPECRGKGIGALLCKLCLRDIALQGHKRSIIPWVGPIRFYSYVCQARIDRIFWVWQKKMK